MKINRFGEPVYDDANLCGCSHGWLPPRDADNPRPCPRCKPHLSRATDRDGYTRWTVDPNKIGARH